MKDYKIILILTWFSLLACKSEMHKPLFSGGQPGPITQYMVNNLPGASEISYQIPDENTLYVKAVYYIRDKVVRESR